MFNPLDLVESKWLKSLSLAVVSDCQPNSAGLACNFLRNHLCRYGVSLSTEQFFFQNGRQASNLLIDVYNSFLGEPGIILFNRVAKLRGERQEPMGYFHCCDVLIIGTLTYVADGFNATLLKVIDEDEWLAACGTTYLEQYELAQRIVSGFGYSPFLLVDVLMGNELPIRSSNSGNGIATADLAVAAAAS